MDKYYTLSDISYIDIYIIISVYAALLMDSPQGMKDFMLYDAFNLTSSADADFLITTYHSERRRASEIDYITATNSIPKLMMPYIHLPHLRCEVYTIWVLSPVIVCPLYESNAAILLKLLNRITYCILSHEIY